MKVHRPLNLKTILLPTLLLTLSLGAGQANAETELWAFRAGFGYAPENTIEGMNVVFNDGAVGAEIDLWQTGPNPGGTNPDPEIILMHDHTVDRTTNGTGYIQDHTLDYIKSLDAGSFNTTGVLFPGAQVPTLREALTHMKQQDKDVILHIKPDIFNLGGQAPLSEIAAAIFEVDFPKENLYAWTPFESDVVDYVAGIPNVQVLYQGDIDPANVDWQHLIDIGVSGIQVKLDRQQFGGGKFTKAFIDDIHANGLIAFVSDPFVEEFRLALAWDVDYVMTRKTRGFTPILDAFNQANIPEPGSLALLGILGVCGLLRRQNRIQGQTR